MTIKNETKKVAKVVKVGSANSYRMDEAISSDYVELDINDFGQKIKKGFVLTKECAKIKELVIPNGVNEITFDESFLSSNPVLEIIHLPVESKYQSVFHSLSQIKSVMLAIIEPPKKLRFVQHDLPFIIGCKNGIGMNRYVHSYGGFNDYDSPNEMTYIKNFDRNNLIICDDAYYYKNGVTTCQLLKVKAIESFDFPTKVNDLKVNSIASYAFTKFLGSRVEIPKSARCKTDSLSGEIISNVEFVIK